MLASVLVALLSKAVTLLAHPSRMLHAVVGIAEGFLELLPCEVVEAVVQRAFETLKSRRKLKSVRASSVSSFSIWYWKKLRRTSCRQTTRSGRGSRRAVVTHSSPSFAARHGLHHHSGQEEGSEGKFPLTPVVLVSIKGRPVRIVTLAAAEEALDSEEVFWG
ncbi:unnamed protein product [Vitrella brassicaformis CCMP3155]|uniref:Secreted protein n=1 Tax=Vitrella brassicaformis (strain CCMP3155) TaxID=1169540 RepID=A0A0G4GWQ9_VITBC|nr:unnamed protein product [Vitrella brassicaformis CCMP3155]|eukprot:CEM35415.1 unnamed protein product [Vitrella brassicaformis CCMP3155]